jgi:hypothetical protein
MDSLPTEIIILICSFLPQRDLIRNVQYVNKKYKEICRNGYLWRRVYISLYLQPHFDIFKNHVLYLKSPSINHQPAYLNKYIFIADLCTFPKLKKLDLVYETVVLTDIVKLFKKLLHLRTEIYINRNLKLFEPTLLETLDLTISNTFSYKSHEAIKSFCLLLEKSNNLKHLILKFQYKCEPYYSAVKLFDENTFKNIRLQTLLIDGCFLHEENFLYFTEEAGKYLTYFNVTCRNPHTIIKMFSNSHLKLEIGVNFITTFGECPNFFT